MATYNAGTIAQLQAVGNAVTAATHATPIVITTASAHGLETGQSVIIAGVGGNTAANGTWVITFVSNTTFSLNTSVGNATYTSGGTVAPLAGDAGLLEGYLTSSDLGGGQFYWEGSPPTNATVTGTAAVNVGISAATNASPIQVTTAANTYSTGQVVLISGGTGNTAVNGTWVITVINSTTFTLNGSTGNGTYTANSATSHTTTITTSSAHALASGQQAMIAAVGGTTSANGTWKVTVLTSTTFSIAAQLNAAWTSGGTVGDGGTSIPSAVVSGRWRRVYAGSLGVRCFGAVGNGSTDDCAAILAAINAGVGAVQLDSGGQVGTSFTVASQLSMPASGFPTLEAKYGQFLTRQAQLTLTAPLVAPLTRPWLFVGGSAWVMTQSGSGPAIGAVAPGGLWNVPLQVKILSGATTFEYSLNGGSTWSGAQTIANTVTLTGLSPSSLLSLTLTFPTGTYVANTVYAWTLNGQVGSPLNASSPLLGVGATPSGTQLTTCDLALQVMITSTSGSFQYSLNGGLTWSSTISATSSCAIAPAGMTITFPSSSSYVVNAVYSWTMTGPVTIAASSAAVVSPNWWGALGNGTNDDTAAFQAAVNAKAQTGGGTVFIPRGAYLLTASVSVPPNVALEFDDGAMLAPSTAAVTIQGPVLAGRAQQIFAPSGTGSVALTAQGTDEFPVKWWGAQGNGNTVTDGAMTSTSATLTCASSTPFKGTDVGKAIVVAGAGTNGGNLVTTIQAWTSRSVVTLNASAGTTVTGASVQYGNDDSAAIYNAHSAIGTGTLTFTTGAYFIGAAATVNVPAAIQVNFEQGALLVPAASSVAINGPVRAHPMQQCFSGAGFVGAMAHSAGSGPVVSASGTSNVYPNFCVRITTTGAVGTAQFEYSTNSGATYSSAITTASSYLISALGVTLTFPAGTYTASSDVYEWTPGATTPSSTGLATVAVSLTSATVAPFGSIACVVSIPSNQSIVGGTLTVTSGGAGYSAPPTVTFGAPSSGVTALGYATISGGVVTGVVVTNVGSGYTSAPSITFTGGGYTTAATPPPATLAAAGTTFELTLNGVTSNWIIPIPSNPYHYAIASAGVTLTFDSGPYTQATNYAFNATPAILLTSTATGEMSVKWWGAAGNGVADDTAAIQNCVSAVGATNSGEVFFPAGNYSVSASSGGVSIYVNNQCQLRGSGPNVTSITVTGPGTGILIESYGNDLILDANASSVTNLEITGNPGALPRDLIVVHNAECRFEKLTMSRCTRFGILGESGYVTGDTSGGLLGITMAPVVLPSYLCTADYTYCSNIELASCPSVTGQVTTVTASFTQPASLVGDSYTPVTVAVASTAALDSSPWVVIGGSGFGGGGLYQVVNINSPTSVILYNLGNAHAVTPLGTVAMGTSVQIGAGIMLRGNDAQEGTLHMVNCTDSNISFVDDLSLGNLFLHCYSQDANVAYLMNAAGESHLIRCGSEAIDNLVITGAAPLIVGTVMATYANAECLTNSASGFSTFGYLSSVMSFSTSDRSTPSVRYQAEIPNNSFNSNLVLMREDSAGTAIAPHSYNYNIASTFQWPYQVGSWIWKHLYGGIFDTDVNGGTFGWTDVANTRGTFLPMIANPTMNTQRHWTWRQSVTLGSGTQTIYLNGGSSDGGAVPFLDDALAVYIDGSPTTHNIWPKAQRSLRVNIEFGSLSDAQNAAAGAGVVIIGHAFIEEAAGPPATWNAAVVINNGSSTTPTVTLVWTFDVFVPNFDAGSGSIG